MTFSLVCARTGLMTFHLSVLEPDRTRGEEWTLELMNSTLRQRNLLFTRFSDSGREEEGQNGFSAWTRSLVSQASSSFSIPQRCGDPPPSQGRNDLYMDLGSAILLVSA